MFTGIVEGLGKITAVESSSIGGRISVLSSFRIDNLAVGDSIAVNGACLTATKVQNKNFEADVSPETLKKTTLRNMVIGELVNLERALKLSDRLDGHLVSGHVDGISSIKSKKNIGKATIITFSVSKSLSRYMISKGSIAVDGISLTINKCNENFFDVSIIPHTLKMTTLNFKRASAYVNIETDIIGKYVEQFTNNSSNPRNTTSIIKENKGKIDMTFLSRNGFI